MASLKQTSNSEVTRAYTFKTKIPAKLHKQWKFVWFKQVVAIEEMSYATFPDAYYYIYEAEEFFAKQLKEGKVYDISEISPYSCLSLYRGEYLFVILNLFSISVAAWLV